MATKTKAAPKSRTISSRGVGGRNVVRKITLYLKGDKDTVEYPINYMEDYHYDYGVEFFGVVDEATPEEMEAFIEDNS